MYVWLNVLHTSHSTAYYERDSTLLSNFQLGEHLETIDLYKSTRHPNAHPVYTLVVCIYCSNPLMHYPYRLPHSISTCIQVLILQIMQKMLCRPEISTSEESSHTLFQAVHADRCIARAVRGYKYPKYAAADLSTSVKLRLSSVVYLAVHGTVDFHRATGAPG